MDEHAELIADVEERGPLLLSASMTVLDSRTRDLVLSRSGRGAEAIRVFIAAADALNEIAGQVADEMESENDLGERRN